MPTYQELSAQIVSLMQQAEAQRKAEVAAVVRDIRAKMAEFGITAADLDMGRGPRSSRAGQPVAVNRPLKYLTNGRIPAAGIAWRCSSGAQFSGNLPNSGSIRTPAGGWDGDFHGFRPHHANCGRNAAKERSRVRL